jgi:hypothetical protein
VGGIFGIVVLVWYARDLKDLVIWRCVLFLISSMVIGVGVFWGINIQNYMDSLWGTVNELYMAVLLGTILLPVAHSLLFPTSWRRVLIAIPSVYMVWFVCFTLNYGIRTHVNPLSDLVMEGWENPIINHVSVWQAAYLVSMFGFKKRKLKKHQ